MHAVFVTVTIEAGNEDAARKGLREVVVPRVKTAPGFVAGYWTEPLQGHGRSVTFWESEQAARDMASMLRSHPPLNGVTVDIAEVREVIEQA